MDPNNAVQQPPSPINPQSSTVANTTPPPKSKLLPIILGVLALILLIGVGVFIAKTVQQKASDKEKMGQNTPLKSISPTPSAEKISTPIVPSANSPVILIKSRSLVSLDPLTGKSTLFYEPTNRQFVSVKWSPDRTRLAYLVLTINSCGDGKHDTDQCEYGAYELGTIDKDKKESAIIYKLVLPTDKYGNSFGADFFDPAITYDWQNSSSLIYSVNNYTPSNKDIDNKFFRYDVAKKKSSFIRAITNKTPFGIKFQVRGNSIYFHNNTVDWYKVYDEAVHKAIHEIPYGPSDYTSKTHSIARFNLDNPSKIDTIIAPDEYISSFAISPDETYISYSTGWTGEEKHKLLKLEGNSVKEFKDLSDPITFAPDGKHLAMKSFKAVNNKDNEFRVSILDSSGNKINEVNRNNMDKLISNLPRFVYTMGNLDFSPDGKKIFLLVTYTQIWPTESGEYAFIMDVDGENMKKITIPEEKIRSCQPDGIDDVACFRNRIRGAAW